MATVIVYAGLGKPVALDYTTVEAARRGFEEAAAAAQRQTNKDQLKRRVVLEATQAELQETRLSSGRVAAVQGIS